MPRSTLCRALGLNLVAAHAVTAWAQPQAEFKGVIKLDVRDSKPDWTPYLPKKAPEGAPNWA